jgi:iron(III) transport system permease protein
LKTWLKNKCPTRWEIILLTLGLGVLAPLIVAVSGLYTDETGFSWSHTLKTLMPRYASQTLALCSGVAACTLLIGTITAWLVSFYEFPGRAFFRWAIILPLTLPTYLAAFAYRDFFSSSGIVPGILRHYGILLGTREFPDVMNIWGAIFIFSFVLYPYVYLTMRASFSSNVAPYFNTSRLFGLSGTQVLLTIALPLTRPAGVAGVSLVLMETLNDYGAVHYLGIDTLTVGIFRTWFSYGDLAGAKKLAALLLIGGVLLFLLERVNRGNARYNSSLPTATTSPRRLRGWCSWIAIAFCGVPVTLGFIFPVGQIVWWVGQAQPTEWSPLWAASLTSLLVSFLATILVILIATLLIHGSSTVKGFAVRSLTSISSLGYAIPGAVIAVGVLVISTVMDHNLVALFGQSPRYILTGSLTVLVYAYCVRFMAVGLNPIDSAFRQRCKGYDEAASTLGYSPLRILLRVNLPILKPTVLAASILIFVDILKELPLTLILRPFNFNTLATLVFESAIDERVAESAPAALLIVAVSLAPIIFLNRLSQEQK